MSDKKCPRCNGDGQIWTTRDGVPISRDLGIGARHVNWKTRPLSAAWVIRLCDWCAGVGRVQVQPAATQEANGD